MRILAAIDFSGVSEAIVEEARRLAGAFDDSSVWFLHAAAPEPDFVGFEPGPQSERDFLAKQFREEHRALQDMADRLREEGLDAHALLIQGPTAEVVLTEATNLEADWILVGSHGHGALYHILVGSHCEAILHKADRPVLVVPSRESDTD